MKLLEFQLLSRDEQIIILYQQGVYIGKKKHGDQTRLLFQLDSFYVELIYTSYRRAIHKIHISNSIAVLDPYLEQIKLEYFVV